MSPDQSIQPDDIEEVKEIAKFRLSKKDKVFQKVVFKNFIDDQITQPTYKYEYDNQTSSAWLGSLAGSNTWSNRELSWMDSPSQLIFGVSSKKDLHKWMVIINWITKCIR